MTVSSTQSIGQNTRNTHQPLINLIFENETAQSRDIQEMVKNPPSTVIPNAKTKLVKIQKPGDIQQTAKRQHQPNSINKKSIICC